MSEPEGDLSPEERAKRLLELERAKSRFFANISHEFRTPLTLILGPVDQLLDTHSDSSTLESLELIKRNGKRLLELIDQLLELSKLENEHVELTAFPTHMGKFCQHLIDAFQPLAEVKGIILKFTNNGAARNAMIDRDKIEKVLSNLLSNAFKFTPAGKSITLILNGHDDRCEIIIKDEGIGVPAADLPHLFDRFYQGEDGQRVRGTGIGLALTKEFVELHSGTVEVASEEGDGTAFVIQIPYVQEDWVIEENPSDLEPFQVEIDQESYPNRIPNPTLSDEKNLEKPIVMLVEDDDELRRFGRSILDKEFIIVEAINGEEGLELAKHYIPDVVITDVMMPKMGGDELCQELKNNELTAHIPVIMLTAKAGDEHKIAGLELGADDYLLKPFNSKEVLLKVRNTLKLRERIIANFQQRNEPRSEDKIVQQFFDLVIEDLENPDLGVSSLAQQMGISRSQLHRKVSSITGSSAVKWVRKIRLEKAKELLADPNLNVAEVCYSTGFNSPSYFTKCFKEEFGQLPADFQTHT